MADLRHLQVIHAARTGDKDGHNSKLITTRAFARGQVVADFSRIATRTPKKAYTSLQIALDEHVELNCDLVFMNHSCKPSCMIDCEKMHVVAVEDVPAGGEITFFYPSTEWEMANPFECWCGSPDCLRLIQGARFMTRTQMAKFPNISAHIRALMDRHHTPE